MVVVFVPVVVVVIVDRQIDRARFNVPPNTLWVISGIVVVVPVVIVVVVVADVESFF